MKNINRSILAVAGIIALNSCATKVVATTETPSTPMETPKAIPEKGRG